MPTLPHHIYTNPLDMSIPGASSMSSMSPEFFDGSGSSTHENDVPHYDKYNTDHEHRFDHGHSSGDQDDSSDEGQELSTRQFGITYSSNVGTFAPFLRFPEEIQSRILAYGCSHHEPIRPRIFEEGRGNFTVAFTVSELLNSSTTFERTRRLPEQLTAISLSLGSKHLHKLVVGDHLFYRKNCFHFESTIAMLDYLVALPIDRLHALRRISFVFDWQGSPEAAFALLSICADLQSLKVDITQLGCFFRSGTGGLRCVPGYSELLSLRGLREFKLVFESDGWGSLVPYIAVNIRKQKGTTRELQQVGVELKELEKKIEVIVTQPGRTPACPGELIWAMCESVFGSLARFSAIPTPPGAGTENARMVRRLQGAARDRPTEQEQWAMDDAYRASWD